MHIHVTACRDKFYVLSSLCGSSAQGSFRDFAQSHVFSRASIRVVRARVGDGACRRYPYIELLLRGNCVLSNTRLTNTPMLLDGEVSGNGFI